MNRITVRLEERSYPIYLGYKLLDSLPKYIKNLSLGNFGIIITTPHIFHLYKNVLKAKFNTKNYKIIQIPDGENAKSKRWFFKIIEAILKEDRLGRKIFLICLGGGTVGDVGGFAASVYKRGIPYLQIPTTLLAQIDSSIGGKTAINLTEAKNMLGTFYQPRAVFIDPLFLHTLSRAQLKEGLAEIIKYAAIMPGELFDFLQHNRQDILCREPTVMLKLITLCVKIKAKIVSEDEKETKGLRTILNFGHTLAHALETHFNYKKFSHGEAVSLGMLYAAFLSGRLNKCGREDIRRLLQLINLYSLPTKISFNYRTIWKAISYDKKFISGNIRMVLLRKIGKVEVVEHLPVQAVKATLKLFNRSFIDN